MTRLQVITFKFGELIFVICVLIQKHHDQPSFHHDQPCALCIYLQAFVFIFLVISHRYMLRNRGGLKFYLDLSVECRFQHVYFDVYVSHIANGIQQRKHMCCVCVCVLYQEALLGPLFVNDTARLDFVELYLVGFISAELHLPQLASLGLTQV